MRTRAVVRTIKLALFFAPKSYKTKYQATMIAGLAVMRDPELMNMVIERRKVGRPVLKTIA